MEIPNMKIGALWSIMYSKKKTKIEKVDGLKIPAVLHH